MGRPTPNCDNIVQNVYFLLMENHIRVNTFCISYRVLVLGPLTKATTACRHPSFVSGCRSEHYFGWDRKVHKAWRADVRDPDRKEWAMRVWAPAECCDVEPCWAEFADGKTAAIFQLPCEEPRAKEGGSLCSLFGFLSVCDVRTCF